MSDEVREKERIAIVSHAFENVDFDVYLNHIVCIREWSKMYDLVITGKKGLDAATARNAITEDCINAGATHMLVMDADHFFPFNALPLLLETKDEAMVSGLVCKKGEGFPQVGWMVKDGMFLNVDLPLEGNIIEVGVCAFGCTLINLDKLRKLEKPYFRDTCTKNAKGDLTNMRSDINLCLMFQQVKERCFIDTRVLIGHKGIPQTVYPQNAKNFERLYSFDHDSRQLKIGQEGFYYDV